MHMTHMCIWEAQGPRDCRSDHNSYICETWHKKGRGAWI